MEVQRLVAHKVRIADILKGKYVKMKDWNPNYIETNDGKKVSRVNIMGTIISKDSDSLVLDDGSGTISVRSFENQDPFKEIDVGDVAIIVGRPRKFGEEIYILLEIIKKINDKKWIKVRNLELGERKIKEKNIEDTEHLDIYDIIKNLDNGNGADIEQVISISGKDAERTIELLLKEGEIFEIKPGKLKVLE